MITTRRDLKRLKPFDRKAAFLSRKTRIRKVSKKMSKQLREYKELRWEFLQREENKICPVSVAIFGMEYKTEEVHHVFGRVGARLLAVSGFLAVSSEGHRWIHANPAEARKRGWLK